MVLSTRILNVSIRSGNEQEEKRLFALMLSRGSYAERGFTVAAENEARGPAIKEAHHIAK
jgi:hypothetical protein